MKWCKLPELKISDVAAEMLSSLSFRHVSCHLHRIPPATREDIILSIQVEILDLLGDLKQQLGISYLFISHDLGVLHHLSDRMLVLNQGEAVESGDVDQILLRPQSAYTQYLVATVPCLRFRPAA